MVVVFPLHYFFQRLFKACAHVVVDDEVDGAVDAEEEMHQGSGGEHGVLVLRVQLEFWETQPEEGVHDGRERAHGVDDANHHQHSRHGGLASFFG